MAKSKQLVTVSPFIILRDRKEQTPWKFTGIPGAAGQGQMVVKWEWYTMGTGNGDYSIKGAINGDGTPRISLERKSLNDLYGTILNGRGRFERELLQLNDMEYAAVIVEANLADVMSYRPNYWYENKVSMEAQLAKQRSVMGSIYAWQFRYPTIRWWFLPRRYAAVLAYRLLDRFYREKME